MHGREPKAHEVFARDDISQLIPTYVQCVQAFYSGRPQGPPRQDQNETPAPFSAMRPTTDFKNDPASGGGFRQRIA